MALDDYKKLVLIISKHNFYFINATQEIEIQCDSVASLKTLREELNNQLNLPTDDYPGFKARFSINNLNYKLYWDLNEFNVNMFLKDGTSLQKRFNRDLALLKESTSPFFEKPAYFEANTGKTFLDFEQVENLFLFSNSRHYLEFLHFLKTQENTEDGFYHFVDHFSWDNGSIVFISAKKEGKMSILFSNKIPLIDPEVDLRPRLNRFRSAFDSDDRNQKFPKFIKAELFNKLSGEPKEQRLSEWLNQMDEIIDIALQNFDIYLSDLSMENIKKEYLEAKDKYFAQLREVLGKLTGQIIALPISISVVALATYTLPSGANKDSVIWILICTFLIYSFFAFFLLKLQTDDIDDAKEQYEYDFEKLDKSDFFNKFPKEKRYFDHIKLKVMDKINTMRSAMYAYFILLITTNGILLMKLLAEVNFYPFIGIYLCEVLFIIFLKRKTINRYSSID